LALFVAIVFGMRNPAFGPGKLTKLQTDCQTDDGRFITTSSWPPTNQRAG
jgi:hypothetical protein